jgi:hypothetical protein
MKTTPNLFIRTSLALLTIAGALAQNSLGSKDPSSPASTPSPQSGGMAQGAKDQAGFFFPGGTPRQFLDALETHYKVEWSSVAEIPVQMAGVHIPALRIDRESLSALLGSSRPFGLFGGRGRGGVRFGRAAPENVDDQRDRPEESDTARSLGALVSLYNSISGVKPELGRLVVEGDFVKPSVVLFVSGNVSAGPEIRVKAYPLRGIPEKEWEAIVLTVQQEIEALLGAQAGPRTGEPNRRIQVALHRGIGLLIVRAPEQVLETAESIVTAWRANQTVIEPHPKP